MIRIDSRRFCDYNVQGDGDTVLVVPLKCWLAEDLAPLADVCRVVAYDPRGRGGSTPSEPEDMSLAWDVADLETLRLNLGLNRIAILGWSYFSLVAAAYAAKFSEHVSRIILVSSLGPTDELWTLAMNNIQPGYDREAINQLHQEAPDPEDEDFCLRWNRIMLRPYFYNPANFDKMVANPFRFENEFPRRVNRKIGALFESLGNWNFLESWQELTIPTMVLHGTADWVPMDAARAWTSNPWVRLAEIPDAGHFPWLENPDTFFAKANSFMREEESTLV